MLSLERVFSTTGILKHYHVTGENQQPDFPGLTRGLVAVLLYYDGRRSIVNSLRALIQSRDGRTWTLGLSSEIVSMTTSFTDQLVEEGLVDKILGGFRFLKYTIVNTSGSSTTLTHTILYWPVLDPVS